MSRFWFLSRFCLKAEGRKEEEFRSLEVRLQVHTSHLKITQAKIIQVTVLIMEGLSEKNNSNSPPVWLSSGLGWFELLFSLSVVFFLPKVNIRLGGVADSIFFEPKAVLGRLPLLITSVLAMSSNETRLPLKYSYLLWFHEKKNQNIFIRFRS